MENTFLIDKVNKPIDGPILNFDKNICNYTYLCNRDCDKNDKSNCRIAKFYNKYGVDY